MFLFRASEIKIKVIGRNGEVLQCPLPPWIIEIDGEEVDGIQELDDVGMGANAPAEDVAPHHDPDLVGDGELFFHHVWSGGNEGAEGNGNVGDGIGVSEGDEG